MKYISFFRYILILAAPLMVPVHCTAAINADQFPSVIYNNITNYCPAVKADILKNWTGYIATQAAVGSTDFSTLNTRLIRVFSTDPLLNWMNWAGNSQTLTLAAMQIATQEFPPNGVAVPPLPGLSSPAKQWGEVFLWTGSKLLDPYTISESTKTLQSAGTTANAFLEVNFNERYVMRTGPYSDLPWSPAYKAPDIEGVRWLPPWHKLPDIDGSFGYVFGNNSSGSNVTASTIVGSSDIYGETSVGVPFFRFSKDRELWKQQLTLEIGGGFATDKSFDEIHPTLFGGLGYQGKFPPLIATNLPVYWFGRVGMSMIDRPVLSATNVVFNSSGGTSFPQFHEHWYPSVGTTIVIPVNSTMNIQFGGNVYFSPAPADWNITLGVSLDLAKLAKGLGTTLGISP